MRRFSSLLHRYGCVTEAVRRGYRALVCALPGARLRGPRLGVPGFDVPNQAAEARGF